MTVFGDRGPPEVTLNKLNGFCVTRMARKWGVMVLLDDSFANGKDIRDDDSVVPTSEAIFERPARV